MVSTDWTLIVSDPSVSSSPTEGVVIPLADIKYLRSRSWTMVPSRCDAVKSLRIPLTVCVDDEVDPVFHGELPFGVTVVDLIEYVVPSRLIVARALEATLVAFTTVIPHRRYVLDVIRDR